MNTEITVALEQVIFFSQDFQRGFTDKIYVREFEAKQRLRKCQAYRPGEASTWPVDLSWFYVALLLDLATIYFLTYRVAVARLLLEHAHSLSRSLSDKQSFIPVLMTLAACWKRVGGFEEERQLYADVLQLVLDSPHLDGAPTADELNDAIDASVSEQIHLPAHWQKDRSE